MIRVLITGCTATQIGSSRRSSLGYVSIPALYARTLGSVFDVEHRAVTPGERLDRYDRVVVFLTPPLTLGSTYLYGALWAVHVRPDALFAVDDWQLSVLLSQFRSVAKKNHRRLFRDALAATNRVAEHRRLVEGSPELRAVIASRVDEVNDPVGWDRRVLLPVFPWGDLDRLPLPPISDPISLDPTPVAPTYGGQPGATARRARRWVLASLGNHDAWLDRLAPCWPVDRYGCRHSGRGGVGQGTRAEPRVPEAEVVGLYAEAWGVLSPAYDHAGSGWWRVRFFHAAVTRAVLYGDAAELNPIGRPYRSSIDRIEKLSARSLRALANEQATAFFGKTWTKQKFTRRLREVIRRG